MLPAIFDRWLLSVLQDLTAIGITKPAHRKRLKAEISKLQIHDGIPDFKPVSKPLIRWLENLTIINLDVFHDGKKRYIWIILFCISTLNMLDSCKDYKSYIHLLNHILDFPCPKWMKLSMEQKYMLSVLCSQYHACWCSGDFRSQGISRNGVDPPKLVFSISSTRRVNSYELDDAYLCLELGHHWYRWWFVTVPSYHWASVEL